MASAQAEDVRDSTGSSDTAKGSDATSGKSSALRPANVSESRSAAEHLSEDASAPSENDATPPQIINVVPPTPDQHPSAPVSESEATAANPRPQDGSSSETARPASWWDYIGWSGQSSEDPSKASDDNKSDHPVTESPVDVDASDQSPATQDSQEAQVTQSTVSDRPASPVTDPSPESKETEAPRDAKSDTKAASVFSAETAKSHGSAWYSPWAWYPPSASVSTTNAAETSQPAGSADQPKTESEMVKEEALARDKQQQDEGDAPRPKPAAASDKETILSSEPSNPIQSSISENRAGWMSFLMSKAVTMKAITNEVEEQKTEGMEVMEIDDEPDPSVAIEVPTGKDTQKTIKVPKPLSLLSTSPTPSSPSPVPTPKSPTSKTPPMPPKEREPKKQEPPAPPLTDSESIKRDTARGARTPSPTPSKSSKTSTPPSSAKPSAPNLVLPTWADTFHTPPRSYLPPRTPNAKSKLTGALSYVAGALFSNEGARGRGKGKGKGKEREQFGTWSASGGPSGDASAEFLTFGQDLPKALDVVGEQLNPYILNGGCRVVVIGVAGWSPGAYAIASSEEVKRKADRLLLRRRSDQDARGRGGCLSSRRTWGDADLDAVILICSYRRRAASSST